MMPVRCGRAWSMTLVAGCALLQLWAIPRVSLGHDSAAEGSMDVKTGHRADGVTMPITAFDEPMRIALPVEALAIAVRGTVDA